MKLMLFFLVEEGEQSIDKDTRLNKELDLTQACLMINPKVSKNILRHKKVVRCMLVILRSLF